MNNLHQQLTRSLAEACGYPRIVTEPEDLLREVAQVQCRTLAGIIVKLLNENEPMLRASCDGPNVTVREVGGSGAMTFIVEAK